MQALPAGGLHRVGTHGATDRRSTEQVIQHIEANVPPSSPHRDVAASDVRVKAYTDYNTDPLTAR